MLFEKCYFLESPDEWFQMDLDALLKEVPSDKIDELFNSGKATIRYGCARYRRFIPAVVYDWLKTDNIAPRPDFSQFSRKEKP